MCKWITLILQILLMSIHLYGWISEFLFLFICIYLEVGIWMRLHVPYMWETLVFIHINLQYEVGIFWPMHNCTYKTKTLWHWAFLIYICFHADRNFLWSKLVADFVNLYLFELSHTDEVCLISILCTRKWAHICSKSLLSLSFLYVHKVGLINSECSSLCLLIVLQISAA